MRLLKKAGKNVVKMSKSEWLTMGKKAGWINKKAQIGIPEDGQPISEQGDSDLSGGAGIGGAVPPTDDSLPTAPTDEQGGTIGTGGSTIDPDPSNTTI